MDPELTTMCYIEKDGKYLMLHRNKKKNDPNHDLWLGIGGHFECGETPEECIMREVKEETGLIINGPKLKGIVTFRDGDWHEIMFLYTACDFEGELSECNEGELLWVEKDKVRNLLVSSFIDHNTMVFKVYFMYLDLRTQNKAALFHHYTGNNY